MPKKVKIIISILASFSVIFSVSTLLGFNPFFRINSPRDLIMEEKNEQSEEEAILEPSFTLPVDKEDFDKLIIDESNARVLYFSLEDKAPIKSIFKGRVISVRHDQNPFGDESDNQLVEEIWLESEDGKYGASYSFLGEPLVKEGDFIEEDAILAEAIGGEISFYKGGSLSLWIHNEKGELISLSKEIFK